MRIMWYFYVENLTESEYTAVYTKLKQNFN